MYPDILNKKQIELLELCKVFKREFYLAGGTAIALQIGHRSSIDFDFFKKSAINPKKVIDKIEKAGYDHSIVRATSDQLDVFVNDVKLTFLHYPFEVEAKQKMDNYFRTPELISLAALKAYALGRRSKWKDYVDLYILINRHFSINDISLKAGEIFGQLFSEKLFRSQLSYFDDIDYSEPVIWSGHEFSADEIKAFLEEKSTEIF